MQPSKHLSDVGRAIQGLVIFSVILGVLFLAQAYTLVPTFVLEIVGTGWALFVVDAALTFVRPRISYALALVLSILGLTSSLPQSSHWAFIVNGDLLPAFTFLLGSAVEVAIVIEVLYYFLASRKKQL
jgi:hypothetical protein